MKSRIRQLREDIHMTQVRLSIELEVSQETISSYENGKHYPSVTSLLAMSKIFNASTDYILGISDVKKISSDPLIKDDDAEEITFLYKKLSQNQKNLVKSYINGIIDSNS